MSHPKPTYRQDERKPRLTLLREFLDRNGIDPVDYVVEVLDGESAMPPPLIINGSPYIETDSETRWRNGVISHGILRLAEVTRAGGRRHGRR